MKRSIVSIVFSIVYITMYSQTVGINTTGAVPATSAMLDVSATNKGLLIPRVDITDLSTAAPVAAPVTSLLVYNTNGTTGEGYYYWDGIEWVKLVDATSTLDDHDWYEVGGTSQPNDINDDVYTQGNVGVGNVAPVVELDVTGSNRLTNKLFLTDISEPLANQNISFSHRNSELLIQPVDNNFVNGGGDIAHFVKNGNNIGQVIFGNTSTNDITAYFNMVTNRVGIGMTSPRGRLEINHDVSSEYSAILFNTQNVAGNGLLIESNGGSDDDTLIYAIGDLNGTPTDKFILLGDGRVGVNQSNPNVATKLDVNGYHIGEVFSFSAYSTNTLNNYSNGSVTFTELEDNHGNYNGTTYTAPIDGLYYFSTNITFVGGDGDDDTQFLRFLKNGATAVNTLIINSEYFSRPGVEVPMTNTCLVRLTAGETIAVNISDVNGGSPVCDYSYRSFMGYFVSK